MIADQFEQAVAYLTGPPPQQMTAFEREVRRLRLRPDEFVRSVELKEWVRRHKDSRFVPELLLDAWNYEVKGEYDGLISEGFGVSE